MSNENWRKKLSYIFPLTRIVQSEVSGRLEVGWIEGRKVLNCRRVNYSYGGLQEALNYGLEQIPLKSVNSVLVLGMGGGSVIESLRKKFNYSQTIVAVELDPVVIQIAEEEFDITNYKNLEVVCANALAFIKTTKQNFDLVIVDLFVGKNVPKEFYSKVFWQDIESRVNTNGRVLFNAGIELPDSVRDTFLNNLPKEFTYKIHTDVMGDNTLIILHKTA